MHLNKILKLKILKLKKSGSVVSECHQQDVTFLFCPFSINRKKYLQGNQKGAVYPSCGTFLNMHIKLAFIEVLIKLQTFFTVPDPGLEAIGNLTLVLVSIRNEKRW